MSRVPARVQGLNVSSRKNQPRSRKFAIGIRLLRISYGPQNRRMYCSVFDRRILNDAVNKERLRPVHNPHNPVTLECAEGLTTRLQDIAGKTERLTEQSPVSSFRQRRESSVLHQCRSKIRSPESARATKSRTQSRETQSSERTTFRFNCHLDAHLKALNNKPQSQANKTHIR